MKSGLKGKHALITGASGGIGQAIAKQFDKEEATLSLHYYKDETGIRKLSSELKGAHSSYQADLSSEDSSKQLFNKSVDQYGRIEILVVNHGIWPEKYVPTHQMSLDQWNNTIEVNLQAAFICSKLFLQNLEKYPGDQASIVYIGSTAGVFGEAGHVDYAVSKSGLLGLMLSLKNEIINLAYYGRVNLVCPGWTITPMTQKFMTDHEGIKSVLQTMSLRKLARTKDIAGIVTFLSSSKLASHISGQVITVAGGMEGRKLFEPEEINIDQV